jgi:hypothetical protein
VSRLSARLAALERRPGAKRPAPPGVVIWPEPGEDPAAFEARAARVCAQAPPGAYVIKIRFVSPRPEGGDAGADVGAGP